jgi:bifunctional DNA primase/polymerase-like protein
MLEAALAYAEEGLRVFPLAPRDKVPLIRKSEGGNGCHDGTTDEAQIQEWWARWPQANVGVATGSGLLVVDLDGDEGCRSLVDLCEKHGPLPVTRCVSTGRVGGFHFWFRATGPGVRNSTGRRNGLAPAIDTRGAGGYVVAPPGIHPSGLVYKSSPTEPIAHAPQWLLELLTPKVAKRNGAPVAPTALAETTRYGLKAIELECEKVRIAQVGTRNEQLNASAYSLGQLEASGQIAYGDAGPALEEAAHAAGLPPGQSWKTIYASGIPAGRQNPRAAPARTATTKRPAEATTAAETAPEAALTIESRVRKAADEGAHDEGSAVLTVSGEDGTLAGSNTR